MVSWGGISAPYVRRTLYEITETANHWRRCTLRRTEPLTTGVGVAGCASWPPGAALASSRPSAPGGHAAPRLTHAHCPGRRTLRGLGGGGTASALAMGTLKGRDR